MYKLNSGTKMTIERNILRGHHLYQLYKAYQAKNRGALKIWGYIARNLGLRYFSVSDDVFGKSPEEVRHIKAKLNRILENPGLEIVFTDKRVVDYLCSGCPGKCPADEEYSAQDRFVLEAAGLSTEETYNLRDLAGIFSRKNDQWARKYIQGLWNMAHSAFHDFDDEIRELRRKQGRSSN